MTYEWTIWATVDRSSNYAFLSIVQCSLHDNLFVAGIEENQWWSKRRLEITHHELQWSLFTSSLDTRANAMRIIKP